MFDIKSTVTLSTIAFVLWHFLKERFRVIQTINKIPGPPSLPVIGNLLDLPRDGVGLFRMLDIEWVAKYGKIYRIWQGLHPAVSISSPEDMEVMLTSQKNINKTYTGDYLLPWLGEGLLLSRGEKWKKDRRLLTPAFHFQILDGFFDVFNRNAIIFTKQIEKKIESNVEVDVYPMAGRCTLDIICEAAMGLEINAQINENLDYLNVIHKILSLIQERIASYRMLLPNWLYYLTPHGKAFYNYLDVVHSFTHKVFRERKTLLNSCTEEDDKNRTKKRRAFLDLLLQASHEGADITEQDIFNQVDTFMFGGHDTTSTAIAWFLYCMANHPDEQERVFEEIHECFGDSGRPCNLEDLSKLKYFECCIKESMRLYPPVPMMKRKIDQEVELSGYKVPIGTSICIQIYALHHNEEHFPDHLSFKPERFCSESNKERHPFAYLPFSAGPRNCIGQKFATYENKVILSWLMRKFLFKIDPKHIPVQPSRTVILKPEGGMRLIISRRSDQTLTNH